MKKLVVIMALAAALAGCSYSHEVVSKYKQRCEALRGEVLYIKNMNGTVRSVDCVVDGAVYQMGDY